MRRKRTITVLLVTMALLLTAVAGVAIAESVDCDSTPPCYGTPESDEMIGTASGETIYGYGGDDNVYADGGNDTIYGGPVGDGTLHGEGGSDTIYGQGGADDIDLRFLDTAGSTDYGYGGGGNDWVYANDGNVDIINCGKGTDRVYYDDGVDTIRSCEIRFPSQGVQKAYRGRGLKSPAHLNLLCKSTVNWDGTLEVAATTRFLRTPRQTPSLPKEAMMNTVANCEIYNP